LDREVERDLEAVLCGGGLQATKVIKRA
jgi:hypothetical protein